MKPTIDPIRSRLYARLRLPQSASSIPDSVPVLFSGDLFSARVATVGLNPSSVEVGFSNLPPSSSRSGLTDEQCEQQVIRMKGYFQRPLGRWFQNLEQVLMGMGYSYRRGEVAHLDLVQEITKPKWGGMKKDRPEELDALLKQDLPFLEWQIREFPLRILLCDGRTPFENTCSLIGAKVVETFVFWSVATAQLHDRDVGIVGWIGPLDKARLRTEEAKQFGSLLREHLRANGVLMPDPRVA